MNTSSQIQAILSDHPDLHIWGNGKARGVHIDFPAARQELLHVTSLLQVLAAADWCGVHLVPAKPSTRNLSTYYWKHVYERHVGKYIPNGVFAVAAALSGLPLDWDGYNPTVHARESRHHPIEVRRD
jgi:hypothetical protein